MVWATTFPRFGGYEVGWRNGTGTPEPQSRSAVVGLALTVNSVASHEI